jgi:Holliday junction resolvasome RuvABC endonuclease subunit
VSALCWLGADVSTKRIALAALTHDGRVLTHICPLTDNLTGARRLTQARSAVAAAIDGRFPPVSAAAVEVPYFGGSASSWALLSVAAITAEAIQAAAFGAVVLEVSAGTWKKETVGHGNATKEQAMQHARALGLEVDDQDLADALCCAELARERWWRDVEPQEAAA